MKKLWRGVVVLAALCACGADPALIQSNGPSSSERGLAPPRYTVIEIPPLPGDLFANGWGLNNRNQVTGASFSGTGGAVPILYDPRTGTRRLNDTQGAGRAINEHGDVAESAELCGSFRAVLADPDGTYRNLGTLAGTGCDALRSEAYGINDAGQVVGCAQKANGANHAFVYQDGVMMDLGNLGQPDDPSCATAINHQGQIVGSAAGSGPEGYFNPHAFLYQNGQMLDLGASFGRSSSRASAINDAGQVVGDVTLNSSSGPDESPLVHAFLYTDGQMHDLGAFNGYSTHAKDINAAGQVVGSYNRGAFLWEEGQYHDLVSLTDDPGLTFYEAQAINDHGVILASGRRNGRDTLMLLVPPGALVAVGTLDGSRARGYAPLWEGFDGTRSYTTEPGTWITRCEWDFGDGSPIRPDCWADHVYTTAGGYVATLTVIDNLGRSASTTVRITALANPGPVALPVFETPGSGPAPLDVYLDGTRSYAVREGAWISACRWDFGDGSPQETRCWAHHVYSVPGQYTVTFTVTDSDGLSNAKTLEVNVSP